MADSDVRALAGVPSGAISMSDLQGKSLLTYEFLTISGGAGGGGDVGGGGGAGGYRASFDCGSVSSIFLSPGPHAVTIGGGGTGGSFPVNPSANTQGSTSTFFGISSWCNSCTS